MDACYSHDGTGAVGGYKNEDGKWNITGHRDRIVRVTDAALTVFAQLYDEPGTPLRRARLPALHASALQSVLDKLAAYPHRLADLRENYFSTVMFDETGAQRDGTIHRHTSVDNGFATDASTWVLSGPHFFLANPFNKTPRRVCTANGHYDPIDLEAISNDYLPRTNYHPMTDSSEYLRRTPRVSWLEPGETIARPVTEYFRHIHRKMISTSMERTTIGVLMPRETTHIHGGLSITFKEVLSLVAFSSSLASTVIDFLVKTTGKANFLGDLANKLPLIDAGHDLLSRYLALNCLTTHYAPLWSEVFTPDFTQQRWSQHNNPRLPQDFFTRLTPAWQRHCALRTDYARRMALVRNYPEPLSSNCLSHKGIEPFSFFRSRHV